MDNAALIELLKTLGQAGIFAYAAYKFYQDGRASDRIWTAWLIEQNRMLMQVLMQQTFLRSPAVSPAVPPPPPAWMNNIPTDLGEKMGGD